MSHVPAIPPVPGEEPAVTPVPPLVPQPVDPRKTPGAPGVTYTPEPQ